MPRLDTDSTDNLVNVNIIYVNNSVQFLLPFVRTLLKNSQFNYRLVSNGCSSYEEGLLSQFSTSNERCFLYSMGSETMMAHHDVLNHLLALETSPYFVFMDSDILASKPFMDGLLNYLKSFEAIFSALPVWQSTEQAQMPMNFQMIDGRFLKDSEGRFFGLSYCAFYHRKKLIDFMDKSGITFSYYYFKDIPSRHQQHLVDLQLDKSFYDTGKLLNILWQEEGARMRYIEQDSLYHIGGISTMIHENYSIFRQCYNFIRPALPNRVRAFLKWLEIKEKVNFRELEHKESQVNEQRAISSLVRHEVYGRKIGIIDRLYLRGLDSDKTEKAVFMANLIKKANQAK